MSNKKAETASNTKVITGVCRLSYANIWEPKSVENGPPKYSASVLIPKTDTETLDRIKAAVQTAYDEGLGKLKGNGKTVPPLASLKTPLRDGDRERGDDPAYAGHMFVNANSITAPGVVDRNRQDIIDRGEVYSGVYCRVSLDFYAFYKNGNRGVACGLLNIQKIRDGEPLGSRMSPQDEFDDYDGGDEDFLS
jgi:hypothetical protein